jgi:outer membrane receptor protein involved in Fe transport
MPNLSSRARARACACPAALALALAAQGAAAQDAIISYPPAFFAAQRPDNAREMLERIPGFTMDFGSSVRGFEGAAGNILVDGRRPTTKTDFLGDIIGRIPAAKVERIDIVRGGAPGIDMQGKPVIANIVLKAGGGLQAQVSARLSHAADGREWGGLEVQASGEAGERKWELSAIRAKGIDGIIGDGPGLVIAPGRPPVRTAIDTEGDGQFGQGTGAFEFPLAGGRLKVNGRVYIDKFKFEEDDTDLDTGGVQTTDELALTDEWELGGTYNRSLAPRTQLELVGLHTAADLDFTAAFADPAEAQLFAKDRNLYETIGRAVVRRQWSDTLSTEAGAEAAENRLEARTRFLVDGANVPVPAANVRVREDRAEAFAKMSWRPAPAWSLDGQVRFERSTIRSRGDVRLEKTLSFVKPRLQATWSASAATQLRLRLEREVGQLNFDNFVAQSSLNTATGVTAGNPDLDPERAWVAEAALERRFWARGSVVVTLRHTEVQGVVDRGPVFTPTGVFDRPANIGDGRRELAKVELTLPLDRLGLKSAQVKGYLVRRWSDVDDPTTGVGRRISGERPVEWTLDFSQDLPARNMTWGVYADGGYQQVYRRFNAVDAIKLDPYLMVFVEWRPRRDVNIRAEIENITERGYRRTTLIYPGPRNAGGAPTMSDRDTEFGRILYLRVRKSFGG